MADGGEVQPQLVGAARLRQEAQEGETVPLLQDLIAGAGGGSVRADFALDGGAFVPANGEVDEAASGLRAAKADAPVLPLEAVRVEAPAEEIVDIAALRHRHEAGGALVQPVHHVEDAALPPLPGQGPGHGGGLRVEAGDHGHHAGGLVDDEQVLVLPDDGEGRVAGQGLLPGRAQVRGEDGKLIPGMEEVHRPDGLAVPEDAALRPGEAGDGPGGEVELGLQDVADGGAVLLRRDGIAQGGHGGGLLSGNVFFPAYHVPRSRARGGGRGVKRRNGPPGGGKWREGAERGWRETGSCGIIPCYEISPPPRRLGGIGPCCFPQSVFPSTSAPGPC